MTTVTALCGHEVAAVGDPGSLSRERCEDSLCWDCRELDSPGRVMVQIVKRLRHQRETIIGLLARIAELERAKSNATLPTKGADEDAA